MRFILVDEIVELVPGERVVGLKTFSRDEELFQDHFPGLPLVPGTLLTEAMAQVGGWLILRSSGMKEFPLLTMVEHAKFRRMVRPGSVIRIEATLEKTTPSSSVVRARCITAGAPAADATLVYRRFKIELGKDEHRRWAVETLSRLDQTVGVADPAPEDGGSEDGGSDASTA